MPRLVVTVAVTLLAVLPDTASTQSDVAFPPEVYAERRARLMQLVGNAPVIVPGAHMIRSGGEVRQDPNFWYMTGVESPFALFAMAPRTQRRREVLFLPREFQFAGAQYPMVDDLFRRAPWNQPIRRLSPGRDAAAATGIAETFVLDQMAGRLGEIVGNAPTIYLVHSGEELYTPSGLPPIRSPRLQLEDAIRSLFPDRRIEDATPFVERLRLVKDSFEIAALRRAAEISVIGLKEAMRAIEPGVNDLAIAGLMEYVWKREGSPRASFGPIVSSGPAAVSLYTLKSENYNSTDRVMQSGELVFIDYGAAEFRTYASDVCRTFPVDGKFTPRHRELYEIVLEAQDSALAQVRPGTHMVDVVRAAARVFRRHGLEQYEDIGRMGADRVWGIMPSPTHYLARRRGFTNYSGARGIGVRDLGHHIGLEALDSRDYTTPLEAGMVFTVEPKLYVPDENLAIMIEDMILVTADGYENLSAGAPRRVDEIEAMMGSR